MTKIKAIKWLDNYTNAVKITKEDVEESVKTALKDQAREIFGEIRDFIDEDGDICAWDNYDEFLKLEEKWEKGKLEIGEED